MSILLLIFTISFFITSIYKLRLAFFIFIFALPFLPRFLAFSVGEGMALSMKRMMVYSLVVAVAFSITVKPSAWAKVISFLYRWRDIFIIFLLLYFFKAFSTAFGGGSNLIYWLDEFATVFIVILLMIRFVDSLRAFKYFLGTIIASVFLCELLALLEYVIQRPLFQGIEVQVKQGRDILTSGIFRGDKYRVMAGFDNPLLLSQFLYCMLPLMFCAYIMGVKRKLVIFCGVLFMPVILATDSRSGMLISIVVVVVVLLLTLRRRLVAPQKMLINFMSWGMGLAGAAVLMVAVLSPSWFFQAVSFNPDYINSTMARVGQFRIIGQIVSDYWLLGFGMMQNFNLLDGIAGLDNYYLRLLLEGGVVSLFLYLILIIKSISIAFSQTKRKGSLSSKIAVALTASLVAFFLGGFFVSMPTNNVYLYMIILLVLITDPKRGVLLLNKNIYTSSRHMKEVGV